VSILKFLGLERAGDAGESRDTQTVRKIVRELEALPPERARYVAAFAFILGRVALADLEVSEAETRAMEGLVTKLGGLPEAQAVLVVQIAKAQAALFGGTEDFLVTRQFREMSTPEQRSELLYCMFAVSAADDSVSSLEEEQIRQIASELGLAHDDYLAARAAYAAKRAVLKDLPGAGA
jgi:uncharacterized tellurite resistance protein B-like protein